MTQGIASKTIIFGSAAGLLCVLLHGLAFIAHDAFLDEVARRDFDKNHQLQTEWPMMIAVATRLHSGDRLFRVGRSFWRSFLQRHASHTPGDPQFADRPTRSCS